MYGLDSIRRFQEGGVTDALVRQYLDSRPGISESQIAQVMRETGVSPEQVARVTGADPGYVSQRYNQYLDLVDKSTVRPFSGPPSPAVSPAVSNSISLTPAGIAALAPSANVSSPANVFSPADYGPPSPIFDPAAEIQRMQAQRIEAERLRQIDLERPIVDPKDVYKTGINTTGVVNQQTDAERPIVDPNVEEFNRLIRTGDPANWQKAGELATSSGFTPEQVLTYLNDPNIFPEFGGNVTLDTVKSFVPKPPAATVVKSFDEQLNELANQNFGRSLTPSEMDTYRTEYGGELNDANINDFLKRSQKEIDQVKTARDIATKATDTAAANAEGRPGPDQIFGIPRFERQAQSNVPFAPLRRGLAQLRPAMYMPGLTSGQAPLGGSGFTPEALRTANQGLSPADRAYLMDVGGVSPAEASAAIGTPVGQLQAEYNQLRPGGLFSTGAPAPRGLPEDFALQTGAYGAPTPTFFTPTPAKTTSPSESSSANANQPGSIDGGGGGEVGFDQNASGFGGGSNSFGMSASNLGNAIAQGVDALGLTSVFAPSLVSEEDAAPIETASFSPGQGLGSGYLSVDDSNAAADAAAEAEGNAAIASMADTAGFGAGGDDDGGTGSPAGDFEVGGLIRMAEGGGPPKMTELSAKEAGSTFDISKYIDDEGRLVGGYSKPIYDENRVITGYDYRPYERDVVFGELRDKEAAMQLTDAEREQMMIEMAMRQGRTGIDPRVGGLAGIEIGDPMMRRRPQYYSTVEQFRPRYAEGGNVSSTAQDLASRGRGGDTMLVHMAPHEVAGLNALARMQGTELTINPETGMPEALKLGKLFKTLAPFIPFIPGVGQFLAPAFGALGMGGFSPLLQKAITSGIVGGFTGPKGGFDLQRGLMQGITAYGLGSLQQNLGGPSTPGGPPASGGPVNVDPSMGGVPPPMTGQNPLAGMEYMNTPVTGGNPLEGSQFINTIKTPEDITAASKAAEATRAGFPLSDVERGGVSDLGAPFEYQPVSPKNAATTASGMKTPTALLTTGFGLSSIAESDKLASAQMAAQREKEEEEDLYRRLFESTLGQVRTAKAGGLMKLAGGGMSYMEAGGTTGPTGAPRDVTGTGDGMSDSVPASIEGVQEARLADGEFVIPADVVADIGNGSSDAGSKKLYDMMDRVRKARHGTTEQPPEIKAERLMPA
jgi:hypothetical protein